MSGESNPFTRVWAGMLAALTEANVSGKELVVLISLMRYQKDAGGEVWRPVSEIAAECGLSESNVRNKLTSLTRKTFRGKDGSPVPVITRVSEGHRGRAAVYTVNLPRECATDSLPNTRGGVNQNAQQISEECATFSTESATNPGLKRNKVVAPIEPIERFNRNRKDMVDFGKSTAAFPSKDEWARFMEENDLPEPYGDEYERLKDRSWTDGEGNPVRNWKAYLLGISKRVDDAHERAKARSHTFYDPRSRIPPDEYKALTGEEPEYPF
jgi:hypothetical protein